MEEKKTFDLSVRFEKLGVETDGAVGWNEGGMFALVGLIVGYDVLIEGSACESNTYRRPTWSGQYSECDCRDVWHRSVSKQDCDVVS